MKDPSLKCIFALLAAAAALCGCGNGDSGGAGTARQPGASHDVALITRARLIVESGGYFPTPMGDVGHMVNCGLFAMGDVDGDGYTDIVAGSAAYPGYIALYSGRNGGEIWRFAGLVGKAAEAQGEKGYQVGPFLAVGDVNADGVRDIFFQDAWGRKKLFLVSGKDGSIIARSDAGRVAPAAADRDMTGDAVPDIVCLYSNALAARVFSGTDLAEVATRENRVAFGEGYVRQEWIFGRFADVDGDGVDDFAISAEKPESQTVVFLSGKDMSEIRRVSIEWDKVRSRRRYASPGDLDGDGVPDIVKASKAGAGQLGRDSYLAAYSGADGSRLWRVEGTGIPTGTKRFTVDAQTGEKKEFPGDAGFGSTATIVPDLDRDGKPEVAVTLGSIVKGRFHNGVMIFSGATGRHIVTLLHDREDFQILGAGHSSQLVALESADGKGTPGIAVSGKASGGKYGVAIFVLNKVP